MYVIAIHPVLQYCYVIARDLPVIGVIVRKSGGLQESWWISRDNTFTGIGSKSQQFSSNFGVDHNFGAILNIGSGAWPSVGIVVCNCPNLRPGHNSGGIRHI